MQEISYGQESDRKGEAIRVLELLLVGAVIAVFELAAIRWSADSRRSSGDKP
jgi:hypothetical protein